MKRVIVTADDFGKSPEVNRAVIEAHQRGILTCASLMVTGEAADEAVVMSKRNPSLKVGLHLVLIDGFSVLGAKEIPDLVDSNRRFSDQPAASGARIFFSRRTAHQVAKECEAQIQKFLSTGLTMDHLNSHHHFHIHPTIAKIVVRLARRYAIPAVRLPLQGLRTLNLKTAAMAAVMFPWAAALKFRMQFAGIAHNREIFGLYETGAMREETWIRLIPKLRPGTTEIFCHPTKAESNDPGAAEPTDPGVAEFRALVSSKVKVRLKQEGIILTGFAHFV